jgi:predicted dehydrogenase
MKRRDFVLSSLGVAAVRGHAAGERVGTGVIGTGNRGAYLLRTVLEQPDARVVALCDIKPDRLDKAATMAAKDEPTTYRDYRRLIDNKEVKAVFVATPCDQHVEMVIAALEAGKHVYCEKPLGITPESLAQLLRVGRRAKTVLQVGQQLRSEVRFQQLVAKIREGVAGKVIMVKAQRHAGEDLAHEGPSADWFFNHKKSGDVIVEMAVHNLDLCNWLIGSLPERAAGFGGTLVWVNDPPGRTNMDGYTLSYEYRNGVKMSFTQVFFHPNGMPGGGQYFYVYGTEGAVDVSGGVYYSRARGVKPVKLLEETGGARSRDAHVAAFYECIRTGAKPPADLIIGVTGALTAILGREAIYRKRVMEWKELGVDL